MERHGTEERKAAGCRGQSGAFFADSLYFNGSVYAVFKTIQYLSFLVFLPITRVRMTASGRNFYGIGTGWGTVTGVNMMDFCVYR